MIISIDPSPLSYIMLHAALQTVASPKHEEPYTYCMMVYGKVAMYCIAAVNSALEKRLLSMDNSI